MARFRDDPGTGHGEKIMNSRLWTSGLVLFAAGALVASGGCGGGGPSSAGGGGEGASQGSGGGLQPCELLTSEQVSTVIPDHDDGYVAHAGGSLIEGVDAYQCSYSNQSTDIFTVVLNVAVDDERFDDIKPSGTFRSDDTKVDVGDYGWIFVEDDDVKVEAVKGRTVIDLELLAPGAIERKDAVIALARAVAAKVR